MSTDNLIFDPQLATDASGTTVNSFDKNRKTDPPSLILRPAFQRNLVWNSTQKSFLVDSILRGLPVPELYIQTATDADGGENLIVVDGQQRISSCLEFLDGKFRLDTSADLDERWRGKLFSELDVELKARFRGFKFIVRNLPSRSDEGVLREIFRRLNRTVEALEAQELRHAAYTGPFIQLVERAGAAAAFSDLGVFSPKDYLRRRNDEFVAEVLLAIDAEAFPNKKEGLDQIFLTYERQGFPATTERDLSQRFGRAVSFVKLAASELRKTRFRNKSDCYTLLVYLARNAELIHDDVELLEKIVDRLKRFSEDLTALKKSEAQNPQDRVLTEVSDAPVVAYLRAVERAASDRLSRVRRHDALSTILSDILPSAAPRPLRDSDASWALAGDDLEEPAVEDAAALDGASARETLLGADDLPEE